MLNSAYDITKNLLNLDELKKNLGYKDVRSLLNWCEKNSVFVLTHGKTKWVNKVEFLIAFFKPWILELKRRFPEKWSEVFTAHYQGNIESSFNLVNKDKILAHSKYQASSDFEREFLTKVQNL